jgi:hypothetical protein
MFLAHAFLIFFFLIRQNNFSILSKNKHKNVVKKIMCLQKRRSYKGNKKYDDFKSEEFLTHGKYRELKKKSLKFYILTYFMLI